MSVVHHFHDMKEVTRFEVLIMCSEQPLVFNNVGEDV